MKRISVGPLLVGLSGLLIAATSHRPPAFAQSSIDAALLQGTVRDPSGAAIPGATVTITNVATKVSEKRLTDAAGRYLFPDLRAANYTVKVEAQSFKTVLRENVILRVAQQSDLDFTLEVGAVTTTVEVKGAAPALNTVSAALSQAVENRYITEVPLLDRDISNLAFLAPGVTETGPSSLFGASTASLTGNNFVSNGQRNATAEVRLDGGLDTSPDEAGGGDIKAYYRPSIEIIQEFTLQNNSFSAEYGLNGGTVINMVTKSGTNQIHGSGYWFARRAWMDANNFFSNRAGEKVPKFTRDDFGGSVGGPIRKGKTFFFFDYDKVRNQAPSTLIASVPTDLQRKGDFSQTFNGDGSLQKIYNPFSVTPIVDANGNVIDYQRQPFTGNVIPANMLDPLALKLMSLYPEPTSAGDPFTHFNNYTKSITNSYPANQFDIKIDHNFSERSRIFGRYSRHYDSYASPYNFVGGPADGSSYGSNKYQNAVIEHILTPSATTVWTNRIGVDRIRTPRFSKPIDPTTVGFPAVLVDAMGMQIFPRVDAENYSSLGSYGWTDTNIRHTYLVMASSLSKVAGPHSLKLGGEERLFFSGYFQPGFPAGFFQFNHLATNATVFGFDPASGNGLASLLLDFGDPYSWGGVNIQPSVVTNSSEHSLYFQDDWRVTSRLTVNLGLRYDLSVPYTMRHNVNQWADYNADTGVSVPGVGEIRGINEFASSAHRRVSADTNNLGPRASFAYKINDKTVLRAGAGVYYNLSVSPADWRPGPTYRKYAVWHASLDGGITRNATLENPFPSGLAPPQGRKYGNLNMWGFSTDPSVDTTGVRNAEIYQWNFGIQRQLPASMLFEVAYSGSRSTHLDFGGTGDPNAYIPLKDAQKYGPGGLAALVPNPFLPFFQGPNAVFNEPESTYNNTEIPQLNLLRRFPQFDGSFYGFLWPVATARYNALQMRFEKRYSNGLNFIGSYTFARLIDNSSSGYNNWIGNSSAGIQDLNNLKAEKAIGNSDTPHRLVFGGSYELPVGRGKRLGSNLNRYLNGVVGGWQVNGYVTFQTGFPVPIFSFNPLATGSQRPNFTGDPRSKFTIKQVVDGVGNYFNFNPDPNHQSCIDPNTGQPDPLAVPICAPPAEFAGNAPRFNSRMRADGIRNLDFSIFKNFAIRENMKLQLRFETFNFTNTPRFSPPNSSFGNPAFGTITSQYNSPRLGQIGVRFLF